MAIPPLHEVATMYDLSDICDVPSFDNEDTDLLDLLEEIDS